MWRTDDKLYADFHLWGGSSALTCRLFMGQLYVIMKMKTKPFHLMVDAWFEYVRGSYISLLLPCLNDLVDRNGLALWFLTYWETYFFCEL